MAHQRLLGADRLPYRASRSGECLPGRLPHCLPPALSPPPAALPRSRDCLSLITVRHWLGELGLGWGAAALRARAAVLGGAVQPTGRRHGWLQSMS